jgi:hypothetical protein
LPPLKPLPPLKTAPKQVPTPNATATTAKPPVQHIASRPPSSPSGGAAPFASPSSKQTTASADRPSVAGEESARESLAGDPLPKLMPGWSDHDLSGLRASKKLEGKGAAPGDTSDSEINLIELAAQIAGTNMALRNVEAQLSKSRHWSSAQLEQIVGILKNLSARHDDLTLFRELLPENDRRLVGQLDSTRSAVSECSERISERRSRVVSKTFPGGEEDRQAELNKLDGLSQELGRMTPKP